MILENLKVCDFRVFSGEHSFDLAPRVKYGQKRPIVLFGGLNGAGKTSILTAVRLGLYGKQSLGNSIGIKPYHDYLIESIHKNRNSLIPTDSAFIELTFSYARHGHVSKYRIQRHWAVKNNKSVQESLHIYCDEEKLNEFDYDQCQAFLNELIPIGVSELFFFDGEKIAELAEDDTGDILRHAVRKLLGLDIIERLRNDLAVLIRRQRNSELPENIQKEINCLEEQYNSLINEKDSELELVDEYHKQRTALENEIKQIEHRINDAGGAWAKTRDKVREKQAELIAEQNSLEKSVKDALEGIFPLTLAKNSFVNLLEKLDSESDIKQKVILKKEINIRLKKLEKSLLKSMPDAAKVLYKEVEEAFADITSTEVNNNNAQLVHDISDTLHSRFHHAADSLIPESEKAMKALKIRIEQNEREIENSSLSLERAPDEDLLQADFDNLQQKSKELGQIENQIQIHKETARKLIREALDITRKMRKLQDQIKNVAVKSDLLSTSGNARELLEKFAVMTAKRRVSELENEFNDCFRRLARKEDIHLKAKIDPETFGVSLLDEKGNRIAKKQMSAGEKQIYAIAILEALAKTSGRRLPVIIDTPLGRLDSKHRNNLVHYYFPRASHQVIILSTDTEVDRDFYTALSPDISQAFQIHYDSQEGASIVEEGYFWRKSEEELLHAS